MLPHDVTEMISRLKVFISGAARNSGDSSSPELEAKRRERRWNKKSPQQTIPKISSRAALHSFANIGVEKGGGEEGGGECKKMAVAVVVVVGSRREPEEKGENI